MISPFLTRPLPELKRTKKKDPQRARVYKMEREFVGVCVGHSTPTKTLREVSNHACKYYKVLPVKVIVYNDPKDRTFGESCCYHYDDGTPDFGHEIRLNKGFHGANVCTLLHELAHYITDETYLNTEDHGKKFVGVYMHLLDKYRIIPADCFRVLAKRYRITIAGKFKPGAIRA